METIKDLEVLAKDLNPVVGFYDPLNIVTENTAPETIGWFRHAEIKHGQRAASDVFSSRLSAAPNGKPKRRR